MTYTPYLANTVRNYRELAKKHNLETSSLSDQEICDLIENSRGAATPEEDETWFLEDLEERLKSFVP